MKPRESGFDYTQPDKEELRCLRCNPDGLNRTGLIAVGYVGGSTTSMYGIKCGCDNGLKREGENENKNNTSGLNKKQKKLKADI